VYSDEGRGPQPHPLQRSGADRKGPRTRATSYPHEVRKRETRQPTRKPCSSPANSMKATGRTPTAMERRSKVTRGDGSSAHHRTKSPMCMGRRGRRVRM